APDSTICKCDAAVAHAVTPVTVREALPLMGISVHSPGAPRPPLRHRDCRPRRPLARHLRRSRLDVLGCPLLRNADRRVGPAQELRYEFCIGVRGKVVSRGSNLNPRLVTGEIEVHATQLTIFNRSETPPFLIEDKLDTAEDKRLRYRYLDLRRAPLQKTLMK